MKSTRDVELRLRGKVRFCDDENDENRFPRKLLERLCMEGERRVERDLSQRYAAPFQGTNGEAFATLPETTQETLRTMSELRGVMLVLMTDFGRGTANDASVFMKQQQKLYDDMLERETEQMNEGAYGAWKYPPLEGLKTSDRNATDDGTAGAILVTSRMDGESDYPLKQITDPSHNFMTGRGR